MTKLVLSSLVAAFDAFEKLLGRHRLPGSLVVLNYHAISSAFKENFVRQLEMMLRFAKPISATAEMKLQAGVRHVALTADDIFDSFVSNGLPELRLRKIPITLFVPTGYMGRKSAWIDYGGENQVGELVVSAEEIKCIAKYDFVDFGSHTVMHSDLTLLPEEEVRRELRDSKNTLEAVTGREVVSLSFPYGAYGERELRLAREAGYKFWFGSTPQSLFSNTREGLIGRVDVQPSNGSYEFQLKVKGAYRWIRWASALKREFCGRLGALTQT